MANILIEAKQLEKQYGKQKVVKNADFQIKEGQIVGLIGPNGAGKTTIMKMLGGLVLPTEGTISIYEETTEEGLAKARSRMSFMIETPYAKENMTARENLEKQRIMKGIPDKKRVDEVLELVGLADTGKKTVKKFSLGMRQRLGIARALYHDPELLVFDEATSALDNDTETAIMEAIDMLHGEKTMVIIAHRLRTIENCDMIYEVKDGKIELQR